MQIWDCLTQVATFIQSLQDLERINTKEANMRTESFMQNLQDLEHITV